MSIGVDGEMEYLNSFRELRIPFAIHPNRHVGFARRNLSISGIQTKGQKLFGRAAVWIPGLGLPDRE